ncbi:MAG: hypothetical protein NWQ14_03995 [Flavobacterium sp.]|jgi:membrane-associated HD superfamily phosphohydrolase|nr:hypothetical protein [Flavobacterium sp.]
MKKFSIQMILVVCTIIEVILLLKIIETTDIIYNGLYSGLAILVMLTMIRLIYNFTDTIYGNHEKN